NEALMIGRISGKIAAVEEDGIVVVDVGGVGYEIVTPLGTLGRTEGYAEGNTTLFIHTHVREDAFVLFGFATASDRVAFRTLIGVSSVGPKTAVNVLSTLPGPDLARAIAGKDIATLTRIPGIGKKTAERLLLELRDKLPVGEVVPGQKLPPRRASSAGNGAGDVIVSALVNMGYKQIEAERAVSSLDPSLVGSAPVSDLLRQALALLVK
ncbi:MAG: Holliday junction branch migration protein RuvA, partial [Polyangiaceae bacterium]